MTKYVDFLGNKYIKGNGLNYTGGHMDIGSMRDEVVSLNKRISVLAKQDKRFYDGARRSEEIEANKERIAVLEDAILNYQY